MRNLVLLAHPRPDTLHVLRGKLAARGYRTLTSSSGSEALASVMQYEPQMLITSAELPEIEGTEVCLRLKHDPATESVAVVLIAAERSDGNTFVGEQVGADALLFAPIDEDSLCARVDEMFRSLQLNARALLRKI